jgi:transitional endoplasmic reticulum ATPase
MVARPSEYTSEKSTEELLASVLKSIPGMGGKPITGDEVEFHDGVKIILPRGMTFQTAFKILKRLEEEAETETGFTRMFRYRPDDGAYATFQTIKQRYGMLLGKEINMGFFGTRPPEMRTINIGVNQTMQVPWGLVQIPVLPGVEIYVGESMDKDYGNIFGIRATGPRKFKDEIEALFDDVEDYLRDHSIYRGHAIIGSNEPEFLDLANFKADQIVFADEVTHVLEGTLWSPVRYTDAMRREGVPLKRAVLLYGPYGTGKTSVGMLTAEVAVANGWTFISARPGRDKIEDVLRTARLYQPAVVFVEDIDGEAGTGKQDEVTKLLEAFDGITAKGGELIVAMTTNHIERIHRGMLRPGRLDAVVEIAGLDHAGIEKLIKVVVGEERLASDCDFKAIGDAMEGFYPAFVRESITRAVTFAISRLGGSREYVIDTPDLVGAAHSLKPQLDMLHEAGEGTKAPELSTAMENAIKDAIFQTATYDSRTGEYKLIKDGKEIEAS